MLFMSTSGALGRFIPISPAPAIWWRCAVAVLLLGVYCAYRKLDFGLPPGRPRWIILSAGLLLALHWVTYFYALKYSSVAVGMLVLFTYPAMTTLLEPLLLGKRVEPLHIGLGLLVIVGVYLLAPGELTFADDTFVGILFGLGSALIYALRNILVKTQVDVVNGSVLMFYQVLITALALMPVFVWLPWAPPAEALPYLLVLGVLTTAVGHTMFLHSFRHFSVSTASLLSCVQPIYGIAIAALFFHEYPGWWSVVGGALILAAVAVESRRARS